MERQDALTELQACRTEARRAQKRMESVLDAATDGIVIHDLSGRATYINEAMTRLSGYDRRGLLGRSVFEIDSRMTAADIARYWAKLRNGERLLFETTLRRQDDSNLPVEVAVGPLHIEDERLFIAIVRDLSERKHGEAEILRKSLDLQRSRELGRLRDQFFSSISHEMRTPLALIAGYAELLQDRHPDEPLLAGILDGVRRLDEQVNKILDYAAISDGSFQLYLGEVSLPEIVRQVCQRQAGAYRAAGVNLEERVDSGLPVIVGDSRRIAQMLTELLENALRFAPKGSEVEIFARRADGSACLEVVDHGPGIPPDQQVRIWKAFGQLEAPAGFDRVGGLGLGLTLVKEIVRLHGGTVRLESEPGHGARFSVCLPAG